MYRPTTGDILAHKDKCLTLAENESKRARGLKYKQLVRALPMRSV